MKFQQVNPKNKKQKTKNKRKGKVQVEGEIGGGDGGVVVWTSRGIKGLCDQGLVSNNDGT